MGIGHNKEPISLELGPAILAVMDREVEEKAKLTLGQVDEQVDRSCIVARDIAYVTVCFFLDLKEHQLSRMVGKVLF